MFLYKLKLMQSAQVNSKGCWDGSERTRPRQSTGNLLWSNNLLRKWPQGTKISLSYRHKSRTHSTHRARKGPEKDVHCGVVCWTPLGVPPPGNWVGKLGGELLQ